MSITSDIRSYADTAIEQGKQVLDQAQAQLNDVTGQANEFVGKLTERVDVAGLTNRAGELRAQAEKAIEPVIAQARPYLDQISEKAEELFKQVTADPRVKQVIETVETRVVKPALSLIGRDAKPVTVTPKPAPAAAATTATASTATKAAPRTAPKPAAKKVTAKAPAKKAPARKSTTK